MQTRHPLRAALVAALVPLVVIAAFGNSWFTEHVRADSDHGPLGTRLLNTLAPYPWSFTPRRGRGAGTIWMAQGLGIVVVVGGVLLVTWLIARHATGASLWLGAWGATVLVAMAGAFVTFFVAYGAIFGDADVGGLGRFWHAAYQSQEVALWGVAVGLLVGALAALLVGGVDTRPGYVTSAPLSGSTPVWSTEPVAPLAVPPVSVAPTEEPVLVPSGWQQQTYVATPVITAPASAPATVGAPPALPAPLPTRPVGDPTVVMVERGSVAPPDPGEQ
jgi:hypothetical protein